MGAVALDRCGDLAAGTSTAGFGSKPPGRVGDSPIIGAGTYADNATAAISATGHGEYFIRFAAAHDIAAMMEYTGASLEAAAAHVIKKKLFAKGLSGGESLVVSDPTPAIEGMLVEPTFDDQIRANLVAEAAGEGELR